MTTTTCPDLPEPLYLPITYHEVGVGSVAPAWGVRIEIGDPAQVFSLWPRMLDQTLVANFDDCSSSTDYDCQAYIGGTYDSSFSRTEVTQTELNWNGTLRGEDPSSYILYNDVLRFGSNDITVLGFPFVTDDEEGWAYDNGGGWLGLGLNSTFLQVAVDSGAAPSTSYGMWAGTRRNDETPRSGLLMIGGYDDARANEFHTFDSMDTCTACIILEELTWVSDAGSFSLLDEETTVFQVSIDPWWESIRVPPSVFDAFGNATAGTYDSDRQLWTYPTSSLPSGSLNFTIKNGYSSSIPAEELFFYPREYATDGSLVVGNETYKIGYVEKYTNEDESSNVLAQWGTPFLTMNYLVVDVAQKQFRLSEATRQDWGNEGGVFPKTLCPPATQSLPPDPITPTPPPDPGPGPKINVGALVGEVVGAVAGLAIIALAIFLCFRRRRRNRRRREQAAGGQLNMPAPMAATQTYQPVAPMGQQHYSSTGAYAYPQQPHLDSYPDQPSPPPTYPVVTQYQYPKFDQPVYQPYTPPRDPQEMPSSELGPTEWRGSEVSGDTSGTRGPSMTHSSGTPHVQRTELNATP
ncbi:hypothetical protein PV04_10493 [Phialophora macrospora]|uniref:Peptidase A1 domain-containing protein n=1 Tax=Phialophora macrospora TaxID=1851006 RepID=A0A0D2FQM1_9EURO|nr:hypothetical protein PV04_10493 [Phialophora macrospora]